MHRLLPPLKALVAFESAARHASFTQAAQELSVTQGAISKQVEVLEEHLGVRLFQRAGRRMALTPDAASYLPHVASALETIAAATRRITRAAPPGELLTVSILPSLSDRWLIPMLEDFRRRYPRLGVRIVIGDGPADFTDMDADIAIRAGRENRFKSVHAEVLMEEELLAVAAPGLLSGRPLTRPEEFGRFTLLEHTTRADIWQEYLLAAGAPAAPVKHTLGFEHFFMLIQAALDGLGIALIPRFLITRELEEGRLAVAWSRPFTSPYRYYLLCPKRRRELRKIRVFRHWLQEAIVKA